MNCWFPNTTPHQSAMALWWYFKWIFVDNSFKQRLWRLAIRKKNQKWSHFKLTLGDSTQQVSYPLGRFVTMMTEPNNPKKPKVLVALVLNESCVKRKEAELHCCSSPWTQLPKNRCSYHGSLCGTRQQEVGCEISWKVPWTWVLLRLMFKNKEQTYLLRSHFSPLRALSGAWRKPSAPGWAGFDGAENQGFFTTLSKRFRTPS